MESYAVQFIDSANCFVNYRFRYKFKHSAQYRVKGYSYGDFGIRRDTLDVLYPQICGYPKTSTNIDTVYDLKEYACSRVLGQFQGLTSGDDYKCRIDSVVTKLNSLGTRYFEIYLTYIRGYKYKGQKYKIYFIDISTKDDFAGLMTPVHPDEFKEYYPEGKEFAEYLIGAIQRF